MAEATANTRIEKDVIVVKRLRLSQGLVEGVRYDFGCFSSATGSAPKQAWCQVLAGSLWRLPLLSPRLLSLLPSPSLLW